MSDDIERLKEKYPDPWTEIHRLIQLNESLQQQLKQSLDGNQELRDLLKDLQAKLDVLIAQSKKRNKRDYGKKTEKHNPRPAISKPEQGVSPDRTGENNKKTGIKHILENAKNVPHDPVRHQVKPENMHCPSCAVETVHVSDALTYQLEMVSASLRIIEHLQETRKNHARPFQAATPVRACSEK
jgi:hypothetical protein